ncbi:MAG: diguanylate cyclase [Burkholderiales bacterium]|nr:diguanylate cyclase [Burkholderiales bacterium]
MPTPQGFFRSLSSLRGQLTLWFGGLSLLTLLSAGIYVGKIATQELATFGGLSLYSSARSAADLLATNLRERDTEIRLLRQSPFFMRGDLQGADMRRALQLRQQASREYAWIGVTDPQGRVLQATGGLLLGMDVSQRPWFQAARNGPHMGDVHEALLLAKLMPQQRTDEPARFIDFAAPILDDQGRLRGVLGAHVHWSRITQTVDSVVSQSSTQAKVEVLIADRAGNILYPYQQIGRLQLPARTGGLAQFETLRWNDGQDYLTSVVRVQAETSTDLGWQIVLRQPLAAALQPIETLRNRLLLLGLLMALVFAAIAYRFATRISRPIEQLVEAVRHVERRDAAPVYPAGDAVQEIGQLSRSIQSMTETLLEHEHALETLNATLEQQVAERTEALSQANQELERLATIDALTGLNNRRRFDSRLLESQQLLKRSGRGFGLILIDADHFKQINDSHGHQAGDEVLRQLGRLLGQCTRITDFVARYGGEEFVVLLPDLQSEAEGLAVAEKIRRAVADTRFPVVDHITVSLGLSCAHATDAAATEVLARADKALYTAKQLGRNRVVTL